MQKNCKSVKITGSEIFKETVMDYKIKKLEKSVVQIDINLNKEEWQKEVDSAYNRTKGKYNIEGFRKGKAPRKVIEKTYGDNVFYEDALSEAFYRAYRTCRCSFTKCKSYQC